MAESAFKFRVTGFRYAKRYDAARLAVFRAFYGDTWMEKGTTGVVEALADLRRLWIGRLYSLRREQWEPVIRADNSLAYMVNCPPFGVTTDSKTKPCDRRLICPFCYGRMVTDTFMFLERMLWGSYAGVTEDKAPEKPMDPSLSIVCFTQRPTKIHPAKTWTLRAIRDLHCKSMKQHIHRNSKFEFELFRAVLGVSLGRVVPNMRMKALVPYRGGILMVRDTDAVEAMREDYEKLGGRINMYPLTRTNLAIAFGKAFRYPKELMFANPRILVKLLEGLTRARLLSRLGSYKARLNPKSGF